MRVLLLIFFRGKGIGASILWEMKLYDQWVKVKFNPTAYANSENIEKWIEGQLVPALEDRLGLWALHLFGGQIKLIMFWTCLKPMILQFRLYLLTVQGLCSL